MLELKTKIKLNYVNWAKNEQRTKLWASFLRLWPKTTEMVWALSWKIQEYRFVKAEKSGIFWRGGRAKKNLAPGPVSVSAQPRPWAKRLEQLDNLIFAGKFLRHTVFQTWNMLLRVENRRLSTRRRTRFDCASYFYDIIWNLSISGSCCNRVRQPLRFNVQYTQRE